MKTYKFKFYSDAGHGWLAVKRKLLVELLLINTISAYSYQLGDTVYLEEDRDATLLIDLLKELNIQYSVEEHDAGNRAAIRNYPRFTA